ncbi:MAG: cupin domain-containing protein [Gemmatimonadales bacterium]|nr:cupin domain-containing protein [Gemmatimonadales bacterium]
MTLPRSTTLFPNIQRDADARGGILSIVDEQVMNVSIITCTPGAIRSNHYHLTDFHFMYVLEGEIDYFYKERDTGEVKYVKVREGDNIFTPDNEIHATYFPVQTRLIVTSKLPRDQETYERDTVRVTFVTEENLPEMLAMYAHA